MGLDPIGGDERLAYWMSSTARRSQTRARLPWAASLVARRRRHSTERRSLPRSRPSRTTAAKYRSQTRAWQRPACMRKRRSASGQSSRGSGGGHGRRLRASRASRRRGWLRGTSSRCGRSSTIATTRASGTSGLALAPRRLRRDVVLDVRRVEDARRRIRRGLACLVDAADRDADLGWLCASTLCGRARSGLGGSDPAQATAMTETAERSVVRMQATYFTGLVVVFHDEGLRRLAGRSEPGARGDPARCG